MSISGAPSMASSPDTLTSVPSMSTTSATVTPMGFGRRQLRSAKTPARGRLLSPARMHFQVSPILVFEAVHPVQHLHPHTDLEILQPLRVARLYAQHVTPPTGFAHQADLLHIYGNHAASSTLGLCVPAVVHKLQHLRTSSNIGYRHPL